MYDSNLEHYMHKQNRFRGFQFTSDLYQPRDRNLLAKLVPTYAGRGVSRGHYNGVPQLLISIF
jgi:hypothetical protein